METIFALLMLLAVTVGFGVVAMFLGYLSAALIADKFITKY